MKRRALNLLLAAAATGCGVGVSLPHDLQSVHSKATSRRCVRSLDLVGGGVVQSGVSVSLNDFPAANAFSDDWIDLEWVVENRALHVHITNRTKNAIMIDEVIVGPNKERTLVPGFQLRPRSSQNVRLGSPQLDAFLRARRIALTPPTNLQVQLCMRIRQEECSYNFQIAPGAV